MKTEELEGQVALFDQDIWSGKTSQELSAVTAEKTFESSSKRPRKWQKGMPAFLDLTGAGRQQAASWEMGGLLLGEYTTRSFGECPSEENVSRLSQILEVTPHQKYSLSAKACQGILTRADRRGKILPAPLRQALLAQSSVSTENAAEPSQWTTKCQPYKLPQEKAETTNPWPQSASKNEPESRVEKKGS